MRGGFVKCIYGNTDSKVSDPKVLYFMCENIFIL
jgi:hypothetical protein